MPTFLSKGGDERERRKGLVIFKSVRELESILPFVVFGKILPINLTLTERLDY